jgi:hypothetical protein
MSQLIDSLRKEAKSLTRERNEIQDRMRDDGERLSDITSALAGIEAVLRVKGASMSGSDEPPATPIPASNGTGKAPELSALLKETLADGKVRDVSDLINVAKTRGVQFGEKDPFKSVNFTLMGIANGKTIQRVGPDKWQRITQ